MREPLLSLLLPEDARIPLCGVVPNDVVHASTCFGAYERALYVQALGSPLLGMAAADT
jgi:hypothetical protein